MSPDSPSFVIRCLEENYLVFDSLLTHVSTEQAAWQPATRHWSLLQIVCHLYDEEREDFRARVESVLTDPTQPLPPIDPQSWVTDRSYARQDYATKVRQFLAARRDSIEWLKSLTDPPWDNVYQHPKMGPLCAQLFLENWLAHDYLHIRQINRRKYEYFAAYADNPLDYAGDW